MPRREFDPPGEGRAPQTHLQTTVEQAHADVITVIGSLHQSLSSSPHEFSIDGTVELPKEQADAIEELFTGDDRWVDDVLCDLEKHRILLLCGEPGSGKSTVALYLAARLAGRKGSRRPLVAQPLERDVEIDLRKIASSESGFGTRTTVFVDAFSRHNNDLLRCFSRNDFIAWEQLTAALRDQHAYLIFTTAPDGIAAIRRSIAGVPIREIPALDRALVEHGFDRRVRWLERRGRLISAHVRQLSDNRKRVIENLRTLPNIARFVDQFTFGECDIDAALERFHDVPLWFASDLAVDIDAWCFALTLALAHSVRGETAIGWFAFDRIRRAITAQVRSDPEFVLNQANRDHALADELLLNRARAEIVGESASLGYAVRFIDSSYAETIWQTAANHYRRVLTALVPTLRTLAEDERGAGSYWVRSLAAQMIGRIGELDPFSISIPLIRREWRTCNPAQRPYAGRVLQAMRTSSSHAYRQAALSTIDSLAAEPGELPAVICAYALIGEQEPILAMKQLGSIAVRDLAPAIGNREQIRQLVEELEHRADLIDDSVRLEHLAKRVSAQHAASLLALEQAVVYLCLTIDPLTVLCEMRQWIARGGTTLVAEVFLNGGIAARMDDAANDLHALTGKRRSNRIVRALAKTPGAVETFGAFLAELYAGVGNSASLSGSFRRQLLDRFDATLTAWAMGAMDDREEAGAVEALFVSLISTEDVMLQQDMTTLLDTEPFNETETTRNFAAVVRSRQFDRKRRRT